MTPERYQRISEILEQLDSAPEAARAHLLDRLTESDPELRSDVEHYLAEEGSDTFIVGAIGEQAASLGEASAAASRQQRFGRYQLVRLIGHGGMGAVHEAVRVDDFHKKVALKIIKQGLDSDFIRTRFVQERQLLASLEHPYIARLLDGGETDDGSPYLVLEFVDGQTITQYCEKLDRTARLRLFLKVCEAVEFAHRKLVVHRDLKPANILVTTEGEPKLLDFGIAKLLDSGASQTQTAFAALTPDYASPEQVRGEPVTTASDVYSLGVILYQLLTGRKPYTIDTATALEMDRVICVQPPAAPGLGDELDHILLMALRKEPERRYAGVQRLADDIACYLDHRPVSAKPDTIGYRAQKFLRRNWWQIAAVAAVILSLGVGLGFSVVEQRRANRRFNQVRQLANRFLFDFHDEIVNMPGSVKARGMVVSTALEYLNSLAADAAEDPGLQWEMAVAYSKVGAAQGAPGAPSLRQFREAMASYEKALALGRPLADQKLLSIKQLQVFVNVLCDAEGIRRGLRQYPEAVQLGQEAERRSAGLPANARRRALNELAITFGYMGNLLGSANSFEKMVPIARETAKVDPSLDSKMGLASTLLNLGNAYNNLTRFEQALVPAEEALAIYRQLSAENPGKVRFFRRIFNASVILGQIEGASDRPSLGRTDKAVARFKEALAVVNALMAADPNDGASRSNAGLINDKIAYALAEVSPEEAIAHAALASKQLDAVSSGETEFRAESRIYGADANRKLRRFGQAGALLQEAERILKKRGNETEGDLVLAWARLEAARGNRDSAAHRFEQAIAVFEALLKKTPTPANAWAVARALDLASTAVPASARARRQRILDIWTDQNRQYPGTPYIENQVRQARKNIF